MVTALMTRELVVQCPNCATQMRVKAPATRSAVTCPNCSQQTELDPSKQGIVLNRLRTDEFSQLPEPIVVQDQVAGPARSARVLRRATRIAYKNENREAIQASRKRTLQTIAVALVCLAVTFTAATLAYKKFREVPTEYWADVVPGMESPEKLLNQYANICANCQATCNSITDTSSSEQAAPHIRAMAGSLAGFPERVEKMSPLTQAQIQSLDPLFRDTVDENWKQTQECVKVIRSNKRAYSAELFRALIDFSSANDAAAQAILSTWTTSADLSAVNQDVTSENN